MSKEKFPNSLKIGEFTFDVKGINPMSGMKHGVLGWNHSASLEITYRDDLPIQQIAHTLVHEALHGLWYVGSLREDEDRDEEEVYVTKLTHLLIQFITANPAFVAWVSQTFADENTKHVLQVSRTA